MPLVVQRVVAFLALQGSRRRSSIAGSLWPNTTERRALGSLRSALWRLPQVDLPLVVARGAELALHDTVTVDVQHLERAGLAVVRTGYEPEQAGWLPEGELLPGWDDEWVLFERERLRQLQMHAWEAMAARLQSDGRFGAALDAALQALAREPLRESAHGLVIAIHLAEGNQHEAVRQYERCRSLLEVELGLQPGPHLRQLTSGLPVGSGGVRAGG